MEKHPAAEGEGDCEHDVGGLQGAAVNDKEDDEDDEHDHGEDELHCFGEALLVLEFAGQLVGHAFHVDFGELLFDFLDEGAEVAFGDVCLDEGAEQAVFGGDFVGSDIAGDFRDHAEGDEGGFSSGIA